MAKQRYTKVHRKLMIGQHEPHFKPEVNSCPPEGQAVPAPLVAPVVYIYIYFLLCFSFEDCSCIQ